MSSILSVSQLSNVIKNVVEEYPPLNSVLVTGEVTNLADHYQSGHIYFSLSDEHATVRVVIFKGYAQNLKYRPELGEQIVVNGRVSVYGKDTSLQILGYDVLPYGEGAGERKLRELTHKLQAQGLFSPERKRPLVRYPQRIGVITSAQGAALHDITNTLQTHYPVAQLSFYPVRVQGASAPGELRRGVEYFCTDNADVVLIARGGGSSEDLSAFNDEGLVRAIAQCQVPVISAVGHETDYTLCDMVADMRAATPTQGALLATDGVVKLRDELAGLRQRITSEFTGALNQKKSELLKLQTRKGIHSFLSVLTAYRDRLDALQLKLNYLGKETVDKATGELALKAARLEGVNPLGVLFRGYAILEKDGKIIKSTGNLHTGDLVEIKLHQGRLKARVEETENE